MTAASHLRSLLETSRQLTNQQLAAVASDGWMDSHQQQQQQSSHQPSSTVAAPLDLKMDRPLEQLEAQSRKLWQKSVRARDSASDARAQYLLAGKGFDAERVGQTLSSINMAQAFEPLQPLEDTDVEGFLRNEHELLVVSAIEESRKETLQEFESAFEQTIHDDWERAKKRIFESLGQHQLLHAAELSAVKASSSGVGDSMSFSRGPMAMDIQTPTLASATPMSKSLLRPTGAPSSSITTTPGGEIFLNGSAKAVAEGSHLAKRMQSYAQAVAQLNETRLQNRPVHVTKLFEHASKESSHDGRDEQLTRSWELLSFSVGEGASVSASSVNHFAAGTPVSSQQQQQRLYPTLSVTGASEKTAGLHRERDLAKSYTSPYDSPNAIELRQQFVLGGRRWLESYFRRYLDDHVGRILSAKERSRALHSAMDRGTPLDYSKVHGGVGKMPILQKIQMWAKEVFAIHAVDHTWEMVDGYPFWVTLFYLIRCGSLNDAMEYALRYEKYLAKTERRFLDYLSAWITAPHHQLPKKLRQELINEFNVRIRDGVLRPAASVGSLPAARGLSSTMGPSAVDPYKYLLYRIIGRIGLDDTSIPNAVVKCLAGGILGWEDDMWFQLMLVREVDGSDAPMTPISPSVNFFSDANGSAPQDRYTLKDLYSRYVTSFSIDTWTGNGAFPIRYFQILLLCGEFERGIQYLWNCGKTEYNQNVGSRPLQGSRWYSEIDALHFAIAMTYYGILRIPKEIYSMEMDVGSVFEEMSASRGTIQHVQIHFARMLQIYTKSLFVRIAHPKQAAQYYFLLCLLDDEYDSAVAEEMKRLCYEWLIELILETGLIDDFLGSIGFGDDTPLKAEMRKPGFLDVYLPLMKLYSWDDFKRKIICPAAERAERRAIAASQRSELETLHSINGLGKRESAPISTVGEVELQQNNALLLYNLAEEYDTVMDILCKRISGKLSQRSLEPVVDPVVDLIQHGRLDSPPTALFSYDLEQLSATEATASSVLNYYSARTHILTKLSADRRKTLSTLISVIQFFKCCVQVAKELVTEKMEPGTLEVQQQEAGVSLRLGTKRGTVDFSAGLMLIEDTGLVPMGLTRQSGFGETTPRSMSVAAGSRSATPSQFSARGSLMGSATPLRASAGQRDALMSSDVDYSRIMTKAEHLRREFSDLVLNHLPDILIGTEMLILIAWHSARTKQVLQGPAVDESTGVRSWSRKSRQLQSFVSAISRWYKIPSDIRRRLISMDETMMLQ